MNTIAAFEDIAREFQRRIDRTIWCSMATVDAQRRVRSRIVHPLWDGSVGWLLTERHSPKARDIDGNPWLSLTYIDSEQEQVHVDCAAEWENDPAEKHRLWEWFKTTPPPHGYDPGLFFSKGVDDASFGCLRLVPWRIELWSLAELMTGKQPTVWKA